MLHAVTASSGVLLAWSAIGQDQEAKTALFSVLVWLQSASAVQKTSGGLLLAPVEMILVSAVLDTADSPVWSSQSLQTARSSIV